MSGTNIFLFGKLREALEILLSLGKLEQGCNNSMNNRLEACMLHLCTISEKDFPNEYYSGKFRDLRKLTERKQLEEGNSDSFFPKLSWQKMHKATIILLNLYTYTSRLVEEEFVACYLEEEEED